MTPGTESAAAFWLTVPSSGNIFLFASLTGLAAQVVLQAVTVFLICIAIFFIFFRNELGQEPVRHLALCRNTIGNSGMMGHLTSPMETWHREATAAEAGVSFIVFT